MRNLKVLIATPEMAPYTEFTPQGEMLRDLAIAYQKKGAEVRVFMPKYGTIKERKHRLHEVIRLSGLNITIGRNNNPLIIKVSSLQTAKIQIYFLENDEYFKRKYYMTDENGQYFSDNDERVIFHNKAVLELLMKLGWKPDIIHCQGWMSGLIPMYARTLFRAEPSVKDSKIIFSIYNDGFDHYLGNNFDKKSHLKFSDHLENLIAPTAYSLNKVGITYADFIVIASDSIDEESQKILKLFNKPLVDLRTIGENFYEYYFQMLGI